MAAKGKELVDMEKELYMAVMRDTLEAEFLAFLVYFFRIIEKSEFLLNHHHEAIVDALMKMYRGELGEEEMHLLINLPPRYGKTAVMCYFVAWLFARHPRQMVMHLSCSDSLVVDNTKLIKRIMKSEEYQTLWARNFVSDLENNFVLETGGYMYSSSTGGEVIGKGCGATDDTEWGGFLWIDDPLKPKDAVSETVRNSVNSLVDWAIRTRRNNPRKTPCVMVMQRLHDNDPAGFVLKSETSDRWHLLKMKALDNGVALWPHKHTVEDLERERISDKWMFSSQYQQEPVPDEGEYFQEHDARYYSRMPEGLEYYICSDIALSAGKGDFTEHGVFGVDAKDNVYIVDWWSGQVDDVDVVESLVGLIKKWRPRFIGNESGPTWKAVEGSLKKKMMDERCYVSMEVVPAGAGDKTVKASQFQGLWRFNKIYLPTKVKWADDLLYQMLRFPKGAYDDKVDALGVFGRLLDKVKGGSSKDSEKTKGRGHLRVVNNGNKRYGWMGV
jgi:predicted phage terminase large subunit-like protein